MQHLKPVGVEEDGVDSVWLEAPQTRTKGKAKDSFALLDLPPETLPSQYELPRNYESQQDIPSSIAGFQPDMDPHLRQTLEALEDDAFVDDGLDDDFFGELVADGERHMQDNVVFDFVEEGMAEGLDVTEIDEDDDGDSWEARFARFKKEGQSAPSDEELSDPEGYSEGGDTISALPQMPVLGAKKRRRKGTSEASGYSMSSSSMWRNEHLTVLDERFDQVCRATQLLCLFEFNKKNRSSASTIPQKKKKLPWTIWMKPLISSHLVPTSRL